MNDLHRRIGTIDMSSKAGGNRSITGGTKGISKSFGKGGKKSSQIGSNNGDNRAVATILPKLEDNPDVSVDPKASSAAFAPKEVNKVTYPRRPLPLLRPFSVSHAAGSLSAGTTSPSTAAVIAGYVRATPPGHLLNAPHLISPCRVSRAVSAGKTHDDDTNDTPTSSTRTVHNRWIKFRSHPTRRGIFPKEGFDHILGSSEIREVDGVPIGGRVVELDGPHANHQKKDSLSHQQLRHECLEPEEEAALQAELSQRRALLAQSMMEDTDENIENGNNNATNDGHEYGASRTPLDAPIGSLREKWRVLPHFLKLRGLMKQHIDSFDHFVSVEMRQIVQVRSTNDCINDSLPSIHDVFVFHDSCFDMTLF